MASEEELKLYNETIQAGCCKRCALRYLGYCKTLTTFSDPDTCLLNFGLISPLDTILSAQPSPKRAKHNPCSVCLGLLDDTTLDQMLTDKNLDHVNQYDSNSFVAYITFPTCILVRDHSMKIHLKRTFPNTFDMSKTIKVNHAWRESMEEKLCKRIQKQYDFRSKLTLHFYTKYSLEDDEMQVVQCYTDQKQMSKHAVAHLFESISDEDFTRAIKSPPKIPLYELQFNGLKCFSETIHLMGNYCKYSRNLPQSCHTDSEQVDSIESIISKAMRSVLKDFKQAIFKASSFDLPEDRVLGFGRTFHVQIVDPKNARVSKSQCKAIEKEIDMCKVLKVRNLQERDRREIKDIMESEMLGPRSFQLLCIVYQCKNIDYCINAINMRSEIILQQKTPLRLLGHRENRMKNKQIFFIKAKKVENSDNLIEVNLSTECGVYVPEFVCGDFGRTEPSLGDLMRAKVDLLALDVVDFMPTASQITGENVT